LLSLWLIFKLVREMGSEKYVQLITEAGWLLSPIYLGTNALF
jgi:hypothetical protein